ncbi:MAG: SpoIIE family protein phosphatase [Oligoflexales bacterium]|nr:SpoIIE family protein phosphatase [Oligoflexales bacterium]
MERSNLASLLISIFWRLPCRAILLLWMWITKRELGKFADERMRTAVKLTLDLIEPTYFYRPIDCIVYGLKVTLNNLPFLLKGKDVDQERIRTLMSWSEFFAVYGPGWLARRGLDKAIRYFETHYEPRILAHAYFLRGYNVEFVRGNMAIAVSDIEKSLRICEETGDLFREILNLLCLQFIGYYGGDVNLFKKYDGRLDKATGTADNGSGEGIMGSLKQKLIFGRYEEMNRDLDCIMANLHKNSSYDHCSIDVVYKSNLVGEVLLLLDRTDEAIACLRTGFHVYLRYFHHSDYCNFSKILLLQAYTRAKKRWRAVVPLLFCWLDPFGADTVFAPQKRYATGEFLYSIGFKRLGIYLIKKGIKRAKKMGFDTVAAEGALTVGQLAQYNKLFMAEDYIRRARDYFVNTKMSFFVKKCDALLLSVKKRQKEAFSKARSDFEDASLMVDQSVRGTIETKVLTDIFIRFNALNDLNTILAAILDTLSIVTGAGHGILFLKKNNEFEPVAACGLTLDRLQSSGFQAMGIDKTFLDNSSAGPLDRPLINERLNYGIYDSVDRSSMIVPLRYLENVHGMVYLGHGTITDLFDVRTLEVIGAISTQMAIAIQSINLLSETRQKAKIEAEIESAKAFQDTLLPRGDMPLSLQIASYYQPAEKVGGDWYGYHYDKENQVAYFYIGDVTGHGIASALMTAMVSGVIYSNPLTNKVPTCDLIAGNKRTSIEEKLLMTAQTINQMIIKTGGHTGHMMSMCLMGIDIEIGKVFFISAGHPGFFFIRSQSVTIRPECGSLLGIHENPELSVSSIDLKEGDVIFCYTDGLLENGNLQGGNLRPHHIKKCLLKSEKPDEMLNEILKETEKRCKDIPPDDDISILIVKWIGSCEGIVRLAV